MGKKQKKETPRQDFSKRKEDDVSSSSPFSSIVLREKKEDGARKINNTGRKSRKASEIVQGYDPKASFADILSSYEKTGNPYQMPKKKASTLNAPALDDKQDFGAILDMWDNRGKKKNTDREKSRYKATRSFGDILAAYEETPGKRPFPKASEETKRKEEEAREKRKTEKEKSFAEILSDFEEKKSVEPKEEKKEERRVDDILSEVELPEEEDYLNKTFSAPKSERKNENGNNNNRNNRHNERSKSGVKVSSSFADILSSFEKESEKEEKKMDTRGLDEILASVPVEDKPKAKTENKKNRKNENFKKNDKVRKDERRHDLRNEKKADNEPAFEKKHAEPIVEEKPVEPIFEAKSAEPAPDIAEEKVTEASSTASVMEEKAEVEKLLADAALAIEKALSDMDDETVKEEAPVKQEPAFTPVVEEEHAVVEAKEEPIVEAEAETAPVTEEKAAPAVETVAESIPAVVEEKAEPVAEEAPAVEEKKEEPVAAEPVKAEEEPKADTAPAAEEIKADTVEEKKEEVPSAPLKEEPTVTEEKAEPAPVVELDEPKKEEAAPPAEEKKEEPKSEEKDDEESPLFRKKEEDEERNPRASWSVFGDNKSFVRKEKPQEKKKSDKKDEKKERRDQNSRKDSRDNRNNDRRNDRKDRKSNSDYRPSRNGFGQILNEYNEDPRNREKEKTFEEILAEKGDTIKRSRDFTVSHLRTMNPQSTLDLHGMTQDEAESEVKRFLVDCKDNNIRKISIITGKGLHSENGVCVLRDRVISVLDSSGFISERQNAPINMGGSGALWVILKKAEDIY